VIAAAIDSAVAEAFGTRFSGFIAWWFWRTV